MQGIDRLAVAAQVANCMWALGSLRSLGVKGVLSPLPPAAQDPSAALPPSSTSSSGRTDVVVVAAAPRQRNAAHVLLAALTRDGFELLRVHGQASDVAMLLKGLSQLSYDRDRDLIQASRSMLLGTEP